MTVVTIWTIITTETRRLVWREFLLLTLGPTTIIIVSTLLLITTWHYLDITFTAICSACTSVTLLISALYCYYCSCYYYYHFYCYYHSHYWLTTYSTTIVISLLAGTPSSVPQLAKDVTEFLSWISQPELNSRKEMGIKVRVPSDISFLALVVYIISATFFGACAVFAYKFSVEELYQEQWIIDDHFKCDSKMPTVCNAVSVGVR